jgi:hypothetical protein
VLEVIAVMNLVATITAEQLDELADLVAERLRAKPAPALVDAQTVADALGVHRDTVYDHAAELGGVKVGDGPRPRWRFDLQTAVAAWQPSEPARATPRRRRSASRPGLLPVHGEAAQ